MAFITEKEELFLRGDVEHQMWYCRMKMPKADRYKTVSLKTADITSAREHAYDHDADVRFRIKHDVLSLIEASEDEDSLLARHHARKRSRWPRDRYSLRIGQEQITEAGCTEERRRLLETHSWHL